MIAKKKKLSRREIKEDKLVTTYYNTREFLENNSRTIMIYAGVIIAVAAVVFFYVNNKQQNNEAAALQLSRIMPVYDSGAYLEAIEGRPGTNVVGLKKIVDDYGSTENGETAKIYLANAYNLLGKYDEAFDVFEDYGGGIDLYKATALAGQAGYYATKGEYDKAADLYRKASRISKTNAMNADYILKSGINYLQAGKHSDAKDMFEMINKEYQTSSAFREVEKYMALVN
jgi:tetratricopeptide (TPR) repeat protein